MSDYISREAAIEKIRVAAGCAECAGSSSAICVCNVCDVYNAIRLVKSSPAADVEPVRRGRWVGRSGLFQGECSVCGYRTYDKTADWARKYWTYCPNCGAKMELEDKNNDD